MTRSVARLCSAALALVVALGVVVVGGTSSGAAASAAETGAASADIARRLRELDRDVGRVSAELAAATARYEASQARLVRLTSDGFDARAEAEARASAAAASRAAFSGSARAAYKGNVPPLVAALLSGDPRTVSDLVYVQRSVGAVVAARAEHVREDAQSQFDAEEQVVRSDADRRAAMVLRQSVDAEHASLLARADRLSDELAATADELVRARAAERAAAEARARRAAEQEAARRAAAARAAGLETSGPGTGGSGAFDRSPTGAGGGCGTPSTLGEVNGFLPTGTLCPLAVGNGHRLRTDAARAFDRLDAAHLASVGRHLCVTDSYRSYAAQVDVFKRKPSLAAVPGTSQHGWGLAVDLCGGVQTFGTAAHEWMRANAGAFGWVHPRWAQRGGSKPEPWHWEYVER